MFTPLRDDRGRVVLDRGEVEHAAQYAGDRGRMVAAVLAYRRDVKRQAV